MNKYEEIKVDGIILATAHKVFQQITVEQLKDIMSDRPLLIDARGFFDSKEMAKKGFYYRTL